MKKLISMPALRIKVTGACNRTCHFCHEEGDMRGIDSVALDQSFLTCVNALRATTGIDRVMFSGGEPTLHPEILELIAGVNAPSMSLTSNGILPRDLSWWKKARRGGLSKAIFSVHDATVQSFQALESAPRAAGWSLRCLNAQRDNIVNASRAGLNVRANVVVYNGAETALRVIEMLRALSVPLEIRLLNDLSNAEKSKRDIDAVCEAYRAKDTSIERRAGTSNVTRQMRGDNGFTFSVKLSFPYFFRAVCGSCEMQKECLEGFYGLRLERRSGEYMVRLCIYRQDGEVLMPYEDFLRTGLPERLRNLYSAELASS